MSKGKSRRAHRRGAARAATGEHGSDDAADDVAERTVATEGPPPPLDARALVVAGEAQPAAHSMDGMHEVRDSRPAASGDTQEVDGEDAVHREGQQDAASEPPSPSAARDDVDDEMMSHVSFGSHVSAAASNDLDSLPASPRRPGPLRKSPLGSARGPERSFSQGSSESGAESSGTDRGGDTAATGPSPGPSDCSLQDSPGRSSPPPPHEAPRVLPEAPSGGKKPPRKTQSMPAQRMAPAALSRSRSGSGGEEGPPGQPPPGRDAERERRGGLFGLAFRAASGVLRGAAGAVLQPARSLRRMASLGRTNSAGAEEALGVGTKDDGGGAAAPADGARAQQVRRNDLVVHALDLSRLDEEEDESRSSVEVPDSGRGSAGSVTLSPGSRGGADDATSPGSAFLSSASNAISLSRGGGESALGAGASGDGVEATAESPAPLPAAGRSEEGRGRWVPAAAGPAESLDLGGAGAGAGEEAGGATVPTVAPAIGGSEAAAVDGLTAEEADAAPGSGSRWRWKALDRGATGVAGARSPRTPSLHQSPASLGWGSPADSNGYLADEPGPEDERWGGDGAGAGAGGLGQGGPAHAASDEEREEREAGHGVAWAAGASPGGLSPRWLQPLHASPAGVAHRPRVESVSNWSVSTASRARKRAVGKALLLYSLGVAGEETPTERGAWQGGRERWAQDGAPGAHRSSQSGERAESPVPTTPVSGRLSEMLAEGEALPARPPARFDVSVFSPLPPAFQGRGPSWEPGPLVEGG